MSPRKAKDEPAEEPRGPRVTATLVGHEAAEQAFLDAWAGGRVPHAWLIGGPQGIGKATLAYRIARFVLAGETPVGARATSLAMAPDAPVFRRIAAGGHGDLRVLEPNQINPDTNRPTREIVVPQVRRALDFLRQTSAEAGWRVLIVDQAEAMNRNAANALLKVLEEPPAGCLILLTSGAPGRLLPTIRSRCRFVPLRPLDDATLIQIIRDALPDLAPKEAQALARLAGGSLGRAEDLIGQGGVALAEAIDALLDAPRLDMAAAHEFAERFARAKGEVDGFALALDLLRDWVARRIRARDNVAAWFAVWDKIGILQARADGAALDRKLVLLDALMTIGEGPRANNPNH